MAVTCNACRTKQATTSIGPTWALCDECLTESDAYADKHGLDRAVRVPVSLTLREAADHLDITPDSLRQAIARGTLKASKRGRDWWVTEKQLAAYRKKG